MARFSFDATQYEPATMSTQLPISGPEGLPVIIISSSEEETKDKTGGYLKLNLSVIEGEHHGSMGVYRLNIFSQSEQAKEIAFKQLSAICHVTGIMQITNDGQVGCPLLHNIPFRVVTGYQKKPAGWKEGDALYTEVKGVLTIDGKTAGKGSAAPTAQANVPPANWSNQAPTANTMPAVENVPIQPNNTQPAVQPAAQPWAQSPAQSPPAWGGPTQAPSQPPTTPPWGAR